MEWRPASLTSSTGFERSSLFQYSNGAHLFHLLRLPPFSFNWSIRRSPRNTCSLFVAFAPHASSVAAFYSPRETSCRVPIWVVRGSEGRERSNGAAAQASPESHHVWLDPHHEGVGQIAVRVDGPLPQDTVIPLEWVRRLDENGIYVEVAAEQLAAHPEAAALRARQAQSAGK